MKKIVHVEKQAMLPWLKECNCGMRVANNVNGNRALRNHITNNK